MIDLAYLRKRAGQEEKAAKNAKSTEAQMVHRLMAAAYARRAVSEILNEQDGSKG